MRTFGLILGLAFCICGAWGVKEETGTTGLGIGRTRPEKHHLTIDASDFTDFEQVDLEEKHNDLRSEIEVPYMNYMEWDENLANKAKEIAKMCEYRKKSTADPVIMYRGSKKDARTVVDAWSKHIGAKCEKPEDDCIYQQITLPDSAKFGCAWKYCAGVNKTSPAYLVVCQYDIKFDKDKHAITSGNPCSKCGENEPKCYKNLCMSRNLCDDVNFRDDCECKLECKEGYKLDEEKCKCKEELGKLNEKALNKLKRLAAGVDLRKQGATPVPPPTRALPSTTLPTDSPYSTDIDMTSTDVPQGESVRDGTNHLFPTISTIITAVLVGLLNIGIHSS